MYCNLGVFIWLMLANISLLVDADELLANERSKMLSSEDKVRLLKQIRLVPRQAFHLQITLPFPDPCSTARLQQAGYP